MARFPPLLWHIGNFFKRREFPQNINDFRKNLQEIVDKRFWQCYNIMVSSSAESRGRNPRGGVLKWLKSVKLTRPWQFTA